MKATVEVELQPFLVPKFVIRESPDRENISFALSELDSTTLDRMCRDFRDAVFKNAGKQPPAEVKISL